MSADLFASSTESITYATVILPLALPKLYTYEIPLELLQEVRVGVRVEVRFGKNKLYSAIIYQLHQDAPKEYKPKPITSVLDDFPLITENQFKMWHWMAKYYCCTIGEVMNASLPSGLKLASETTVVISPTFDGDYSELNDKEYLVTEALTIQAELSIGEIKKILNQSIQKKIRWIK